ncbi:MAG: ATP synthase subunit C [Acutalibacteraceae bacterium]|jgi:V/A-type H+-transporting ATPase subunit K
MIYVLLLVPVALLVASVIYAIRMVQNGKSPRKAATMQILSFLAVCVISFALPFAAQAAETNDTVATAETTQTAADNSKGLGLLAAALVTGLAGIGGGIAVAAAAPAAIGATSEDPKAFGKSLIFVALGEGIAIYGLLISIMILNKV